MQKPSPFKFTLRKQLLLVSLTLLLIPWVGYRYLLTVENYLRAGREAVLLERAHAATAMLAEQAQLFAAREEATPTPTDHVFVRPLRAPITIDGYDDDWALYRDREQSYASDHVLYAQGAYRPESLSFSLVMGSAQGRVYLLFRVRDDQIVYRDPAGAQADNNDFIELQMQDHAGQRVSYVLATSAPGWISVQRRAADDSDTLIPESRIKGEWQETPLGYNVELRIPLTLLGERMAFSVNDVDDTRTRAVVATVGTAAGRGPDALGTVGVSVPYIQSLLHRLTPPGARTWVVDAQQRVMALEGGLKSSADEGAESETVAPSGDGGWVHALYRLVLRQPVEEFQDDLSVASRLEGPVVAAALGGLDATRWRTTPDGRTSILTAATPVRVNDAVAGAVVVEETSNGILLLQNQALETLINLSAVALAIVVSVLLVFATRLSMRVRRLRDAAEAAIAPDGRVNSVRFATAPGDEIGDLSRSFQAMLERLSQYNQYLESMAGKLSHELRTPITVVRSSLDNLDMARTVEERADFARRAREGVDRLSGILSRMSEATRLEQTLQTEVRVDFDLEEVVRGCVEGFRMAHPAQAVQLTVNKPPNTPIRINGSPDLIAQMLDKLLGNARDFCTLGSAVEARIDAQVDRATLCVANAGPQLPEAMAGRLFDSMVSVRIERGDEPHLGLGLYIVRLIAEFHRGQARAANRADGAEFTVEFPLSRV